MALKLIPLPESEPPKRVRTLIRHLLWVPVELTRHARQIKACLYLPAGWTAWWRGFLAQWLPQCRQWGPIAVGGERHRANGGKTRALGSRQSRGEAGPPPAQGSQAVSNGGERSRAKRFWLSKPSPARPRSPSFPPKTALLSEL